LPKGIFVEMVLCRNGSLGASFALSEFPDSPLASLEAKGFRQMLSICEDLRICKVLLGSQAMRCKPRKNQTLYSMQKSGK
jgi:hypothetical protein